jgi:hypothetical protein
VNPAIKTSEFIRACLEKLRSLYRTIESVTARLGSDPQDDLLDRTLAERARLLAEADRRMAQLDNNDKSWRRTLVADNILSGIMSDIERSIRCTAAYDARLVAVIAQRMDAIETELLRINTSSNAMRAYALQNVLSRVA